MARPSKGGAQVNVRLTEEDIAALDAWVEEVRTSGALGTSGVTRSDLIREAVQAKLRERAAGPKGKAKR